MSHPLKQVALSSVEAFADPVHMNRSGCRLLLEKLLLAGVFDHW